MSDKLDFNNTYELIRRILQKNDITDFSNSLIEVVSEVIAGLNTFNNYKLSKIKSSLMFKESTDLQFVVGLARSLFGYSPKRKISAKVEVLLSFKTALVSSVTIPKYSVFSIRNYNFINTDDIIIPNGIKSYKFILTQGDIETESFNIQNNSRIKLKVGNWEIENNSVITNPEFKKFKDFIDFQSINSLQSIVSEKKEAETGFLRKEDVGAYIDYTDYEGNTFLEFLLNDDLRVDNIEVSYLRTDGADIEINNTDLDVIFNNDVLPAGYIIKTTSPITGGADQDNIEDIKTKSYENITLNKKSLVTYNEYLSKLKEFTGVKLCEIWNEEQESLYNQEPSPILMNRYFYSIIFNTMRKNKQTNLLIKKGVEHNLDFIDKNNKIIKGFFKLDLDPKKLTRNLYFKDTGDGLLYSENTLPIQCKCIFDFEPTSVELKQDYNLDQLYNESQNYFFECPNPNIDFSVYYLIVKIGEIDSQEKKINLIRLRYPLLKDFPTQNNLNSIKVYKKTGNNEKRIISTPKYFENIIGNNFSDWLYLKETIGENDTIYLSLENNYYDTKQILYPIRISNIEFSYVNKEENYIDYDNKSFKISYFPYEDEIDPIVPTPIRTEEPIISPAEKDFTDPFEVTITCPDDKARIFYKINNETVYREYKKPIKITNDLAYSFENPTVKVFAKAKTGEKFESNEIFAVYTSKNKRLEKPTITPKGKQLKVRTQITITSATEDETILYYIDDEGRSTLDKKEWIVYDKNNKFYIEYKETGIIKLYAKTKKEGFFDSEEALEIYSFEKPLEQLEAPVFSPKSQSYTDPIKVKITSSMPGAFIQYTLNDNEDLGWLNYVNELELKTRTVKITAVASLDGYIDSEKATETYTYVPPQPEPQASLIQNKTVLKADETKLSNLIIGTQIEPNNVETQIEEHFKDSKELLVSFIKKDPIVRLIDFNILVFLKNDVSNTEKITETINFVVEDYIKRYNKVKLLEINDLLFREQIISEECKRIDFKSPLSDLESLNLIFYVVGDFIVKFK